MTMIDEEVARRTARGCRLLRDIRGGHRRRPDPSPGFEERVLALTSSPGPPPWQRPRLLTAAALVLIVGAISLPLCEAKAAVTECIPGSPIILGPSVSGTL